MPMAMVVATETSITIEFDFENSSSLDLLKAHLCALSLISFLLYRMLWFSAPAIVVNSIHAVSLCVRMLDCAHVHFMFFYMQFLALLPDSDAKSCCYVEMFFACCICITINRTSPVHFKHPLSYTEYYSECYTFLIWNSDFSSASYHNLFRLVRFWLFVCTFILCNHVSASNNSTGEFITILTLSLASIVVACSCVYMRFRMYIVSALCASL